MDERSPESRKTRRPLLLRAVVAVLLVLSLAAPASVSAQSEGGGGLGVKVDRLDSQLQTLTRRLKRTRAVIRRQASRLARMERRLDDGAATVLRSLDGRFAVQASNEGLRLRGPGASLVVSATALTLASGASMLQIAPAATTLAAPLVRFGSGSNCPPVARRGDAVALQAELGRGSISGSSTGVFAC